ncbi:MAG: hypothetical protein H7123_09405, partial [Thermoleophilia bacterium]|nr:hypothetical protein [Thermoleophilia bacterium]
MQPGVPSIIPEMMLAPTSAYAPSAYQTLRSPGAQHVATGVGTPSAVIHDSLLGPGVHVWHPPLKAHRHAIATAPVVVGRTSDPRLTEISGVVASATRPDTYWVHNDSGDSPRVFSLNEHGDVLSEVTVKGAKARDWEDIAIGPGSRPGVSAVYVADTGDNLHIRRSVQVYRFDEPSATDTSVDAQRLNFQFPDHLSHNVESVFVDPRTGDLMMVGKRDKSGARLYRAPKTMVDAGGGRLESAGLLDIGPLATGADISADGSQIVVRPYSRAYLWRRGPQQSIADAMKAAPELYEVPSSEAIA